MHGCWTLGGVPDQPVGPDGGELKPTARNKTSSSCGQLNRDPGQAHDNEQDRSGRGIVRYLVMLRRNVGTSYLLV